MNRIFRAIPTLLFTVAVFLAPLVPLAVVGGLVVTQTACPSSKQVAAIADQVVKEIDGALPLLRSRGVNTAKLEQVRSIAAKVKEAFNSGDTSNAISLTEDLLDAFDSVVGDIEALNDEATRTLILVGLFVVRRVLVSLADKLADEASKLPPSSAARSATMRGAKIAAFRKRAAWRCRSSSTGRYEKMDFCRRNPATSTVETQ